MNKFYLIKFWIITLISAPFLVGIYEIFRTIPGQVVGLLDVYPVTLIVSIVWSLPTLTIAYLVFYILDKLKIKPIIVKTTLISITIIGITITFIIIKGSLVMVFIVAYSFSALISGIIFKIKKL